MHEFSLQFILIIFLIFVLAGCVKGTVGMGLPAISIGLISLFTTPAEAAALLIVPTLVTNIWQFVAGPHCRVLLRRMWLMLLSISIVTAAAAGLITRSGVKHADMALGGALIAYAIISISNIRVSVSKQAEPWLSPLIGSVTGVVTGSTGVLVIPAAPYLQALGLDKEELIQALGLSFATSTIALAAGLACRGDYHIVAAGASILCIVPTLAGMFLGRWIRVRINPETFRLLFLAALMLLGGSLILRSVS